MIETAKPPARANARPTDGYVLSVDGKWKQRYETAKEAMAAGEILKGKFPVVQISVYDAAEGIYTAVPAAVPEV